MGFIPEDIITQVLERSDIVEIISSYVPLKRTGRNFKANCPFHNEKTPSFVVNPDKRIFHCFGCSVGGNVFTFIMQQEHVEFPDAVRLLAQKSGIAIPSLENSSSSTRNLRQSILEINDLTVSFFHQILLSDRSSSTQEAREYLKGRGINLEAVKKFKIGFAVDQWDSLINFLRKKDYPLSLMEKAGLIIAKESRDGFYDRFRNRIIFPIFDIRNQCLGFGARAMKDSIAKYINSPETPVYVKGHHLYGFHLSKDAVVRQDFVMVVEGYMDFIVPYQAGIENLVASLGTALTIEQIRLLRRYTQNILMLFDSDQAGESAMVRSLDLLIEEGMNIKVVTLNKGEDPDSFIRKFGVAAFQEKILQAQSFFDFKLNNLISKIDCKTIEGRAQVATQMLAMVQKFTNEVIRFGYLRKLSDTLAVPEQALLLQMQKSTPFSSGINGQIVDRTKIQSLSVSNSTAAESGFVTKPGTRAVEYMIVKLLLEGQDFVSFAKEELALNDFRDEDARSIMGGIWELFEQGKEVSTQNLMNCFKDQKILQKISQLMVEDDYAAADKIKMLGDCIKRLKIDRIKLQRQNLTHQIKLAEVSGDGMRVSQLKEKFNQLIKEAI